MPSMFEKTVIRKARKRNEGKMGSRDVVQKTPHDVKKREKRGENKQRGYS